MDDDEYDDDIADEDLLLALGPASAPTPTLNRASAAPIKASRGPQQTSTGQFGARQPVGVRNGSARWERKKPPQQPPSHAAAGSAVWGAPSLEDLPSDAFDSSTDQCIAPPNNHGPEPSSNARVSRPAGQTSFRQTTLWGQTLADEGQATGSQNASGRVYRGDMPPEVPTHHTLDHEALRTWVYPTNLGPIRDYQFSIVKNGLFNNTLVALPTGLGKTFIAATVMLNYYRWTASGKIVFVAPTKPLASQQVDACLNVAGIPRSQSTLLTGEIAPALREDEWASRRLFFMTPQTLLNDLGKGYADPKSIVLLVVDEAHRATGDYAYVKVAEFIRRFSSGFRVLALTATPGSTVEGVQEVIDNLGISHIEIRTEESMDIRQFVHSRQIERVVLEPSDEIMHICDLFSKALKPLCDKLSQQNIWYGRDPMALTTYGLMKTRQDWLNGPARHLNQGAKFMIIAIFAILQSVAHSIKLLHFHGIKPFHDSMLEFRSSTEEKGDKGSKNKRQLIGDANFQEMMDTIAKWLRADNFVSHPKITYLCDNLLNHFMDAGEGSNTRAIVFSEYRDSAEEIVRTLNTHKPLISAAVFVGQADSKRSAGMKQKQQIETIEKFKNGSFNVLVATSIGEEGLDIGQVDLIVCYDASSSPIRMLQRMGRTGRKRAGSIILLLMKGKEEKKFEEAQDNYSQMQKMICEGSRFNFRHDLSSRIIPRDVKPEVDKRLVDIPIENTQTKSLPEPKKSRAKKKASKKKFHMPDGVETGFSKASARFGQPEGAAPKPKPVELVEMDFLADVPEFASVLLTPQSTVQLNKLYRDLPFRHADLEEISSPNLCAHAKAQRRQRATVKVKHGAYTRRAVRLFKKLGESQLLQDRHDRPYGEEDASRYESLSVPAFAEEESDGSEDAFTSDGINLSRSLPRVRSPSHEEDEDEDKAEEEQRRPQKRKPKPKPRQTSKAQQRKKQERSYFSEASEGLSDEEEELEAGSPQPSLRDHRAPKTGKGSRRWTAHSFEERGDDCLRTSDNYDTDGSDSGADLEGFIIGDDEVTSSMRRENATSPTTASPASAKTARTAKTGAIRKSSGKAAVEQPFFVPAHFTQTQDSDDEMPDIGELIGAKRPRAKTTGDDSDDGVLSRPQARKKRQLFVGDSDTE